MKELLSDIGVLVFVSGILGLLGTLITRIFFGILANAGASMIIILAIIFGLILMWCDENKAAVQ